MRNSSRFLLGTGSLLVILIFFQNCGGFSNKLGSSSLASFGIRADGCAQGAMLFSGACRKINSIPLSGSSVTTATFPNFQKFVYSVSLPNAVNFTGLTGVVSLDSTSQSFTEALYTIGYSPSGSCPASGSAFPDYDSVFATMPDNKFINQYIIKAQGGHVEMPAVYNVAYPVAVSGCFFVVLDGSAGLAGTSDTMSVDLKLNVVGGDPVAANVMWGLTNYEHFAQPSKAFSSTNQYLEVNQVTTPIHVSGLVGNVSNAAFDFFSLTPPSGKWNTHNTIYLVRNCGSYSSGTFQDQDFYSQVPQNAITLFDYSAETNGRGVVQTSINLPLDLDFHKGDCIVHIIAGNANGALDFEDALAFNGAQGSNHPVLGNIDGIATGDITGWACQQGSADSIQIELYLGGKDYGTYSASQASEPAVAQACGSTGTAYRFTIEIAGDIATNYAGKAVTIYGLSTNVANNNALNNSAVFKIPSASASASAPSSPSSAAIGSTLSAADQAAIVATVAAVQGQTAASAAAAQAAAAAQSAAAPSAISSAISSATSSAASSAASASPAASAPSSTDQATADAASLAAQQAAAFDARVKIAVNRYVSAKGNHIFARADASGVASGYTLEGPVFNVYAAQYASTVQLFKCNTAGHQMLSLDPNCEGQTVVGPMGWISSAHVKNSSPLYRMHTSGSDYIEANDQSVLSQGYVLDGQLGFTP